MTQREFSGTIIKNDATFDAALMSAVGCDVEFYAIFFGFWAFVAPQYIALVGISSGF